MKKINVLMCGSDFSVKGGMVTVEKNYLEYENWGKYHLIFVPTHIEKNGLLKAVYFAKGVIKVLYHVIFSDIQIAHLHVSERGSVYRKAILARILKLFKVNVILHHHGAEFEEFYDNISACKRKFVNRTLRLVDTNIVLSKRLISMITEKEPYAHVIPLYNAVRTCSMNPYSYNSYGILFLGRLCERKGIYDLLQVIKDARERIPKRVKFFLCGDGDIDEVKKKITELRITDFIEYLGWIDAEKKKKFFLK